VGGRGEPPPDVRTRRKRGTLTYVDQRRLSKLLSLVLRHRPAAAGVRLDASGWVDVDRLVAGLSERGRTVTRADVERVVATNDKRRFTLDPARNRIRANQGHSVPVDLGLEPQRPPRQLFHGTQRASVEKILREGLHRAGRHAVHLSVDEVTAARVGARRGPSAVLRVGSDQMHADGHRFTVSANGIWLVEAVPPRYLTVVGSGGASVSPTSDSHASERD
jgi:putative RNA 2'-phosphotransferase